MIASSFDASNLICQKLVEMESSVLCPYLHFAPRKRYVPRTQGGLLLARKWSVRIHSRVPIGGGRQDKA